MNDAMKLLCKLCLLAAFFVLAPPEVLAQTIAKGQVLDSTNEPIIGATVVEKGNAKNAAVTDFDGNFTLKLQNSKQVVISYVGMLPKEVAASEHMTVILEDNNQALEEVMVVGYAVGSKRTISGAVDRIKKEDMNQGVVNSPADASKVIVALLPSESVTESPFIPIELVNPYISC